MVIQVKTVDLVAMTCLNKLEFTINTNCIGVNVLKLVFVVTGALSK